MNNIMINASKEAEARAGMKADADVRLGSGAGAGADKSAGARTRADADRRSSSNGDVMPAEDRRSGKDRRSESATSGYRYGDDRRGVGHCGNRRFLYDRRGGKNKPKQSVRQVDGEACAAVSDAAARCDTAVIDGIDFGAAMERFGDAKSFLDVLVSFSENTKILLDTIADVDETSIGGYTITVHGLKCFSKGICAYAISNLAESLEWAAKAKNIEFVQHNNPNFFDELHRLVADIDVYIEQAR